MSRVLNADKLRELGNTAFSRKDYQEAIQLYTQAIQVEPNISFKKNFFQIEVEHLQLC